ARVAEQPSVDRYSHTVMAPRSRRRVLSEPQGEPSVASARGGRPKDGVRREAALTAARELLIAKGYDEVTLSEVAQVAGVSRPFVYDNWGTKFALVEDAIFTTDDPGPLIDDDKPFAESLTDLIAAMV